MPRCTELATSQAAKDQEFIPLRDAACRAYAAQDEKALFSAYSEMFKKSEAMLSEFPAQQECRTASGEKSTFDLPNRSLAEGYVQMGVEASYKTLRSRIITGCGGGAPESDAPKKVVSSLKSER